MPEFPRVMWNAIAQAETGGEKNPWVRTRVRPAGGSTAFGPVQVTGTTAEDYVNRGLVSPESAQFYKQKMAPMFDKFKQYGNEPNRQGYDPRYDYGGTGDMDPMENLPAYQQFTEEMMKAMWNESGGNPEAFIQRWRGKPRSADPRYYDSVMSAFKEFK